MFLVIFLKNNVHAVLVKQWHVIWRLNLPINYKNYKYIKITLVQYSYPTACFKILFCQYLLHISHLP